MKIAILFVFTLTIVCARQLNCTNRNVISYVKDATYNFSVRLLDRVSQETESHFVFSPLSTWWQLTTLNYGARSSTRKELRRLTRYHRQECFQTSFNYILKNMHRDLEKLTKTNNIMAINSVLDVKDTFKKRVRHLSDTTILLLNFYEPEKASYQMNRIVRASTNGVLLDVVDSDDLKFNLLVLLETGYFESDWLVPFNAALTTQAPFYSESNVAIGNVSMMTNTGYYLMTDVPFLNARLLEIPFNARRKLSMLVILPNEGSVRDVYYNLRYTTLRTIRNMLRHNRRKLVTVKLPRFKIRSHIENLPELIYDMGLKRIFYPDMADFRGISKYKMHVSSMSQVIDIEVTEKGAKVNVAEYLIKNNASNTEFVVNRPFAYLIVDWRTNLILFAGSYSQPSVF